MKAVITSSNISIAGFDYFVGSAPSVCFGGWGEERSSPIHKNFLNQVGVIPAAKLVEVKLLVSTLDVEFSASVGAELFAGLKVPGLKGGVRLGVGAFRDGHVKLMMVSPQGDNELVRQVNNSPAVLRQLVEIGGDARVVETTLVVVEAELHRRFQAGLSTKGSATIVEGAKLRAERSAGVQNETTLDVSPGTCLGYGLAEPRWAAVMDRNKTRVVGLRPDRHGM